MPRYCLHWEVACAPFRISVKFCSSCVRCALHLLATGWNESLQFGNHPSLVIHSTKNAAGSEMIRHNQSQAKVRPRMDEAGKDYGTLWTTRVNSIIDSRARRSLYLWFHFHAHTLTCTRMRTNITSYILHMIMNINSTVRLSWKPYHR